MGVALLAAQLVLAMVLMPPGPAAGDSTLFVSTKGSDTTGDGTAASPLASCAGAVAKLGALAKAGQPVIVQFAPGTYLLNGSTACGSVRWDGSEAAPLVFAGDPAGGTQFDASSRLDASQLQPVTEPRISALVNPRAQGMLLVMPLDTKPSTLEWDGRPLFSSVFPNPEVGTGVAYVRKIFDRGAYYFKGRSSWPSPARRMHVCMGDDKSNHTHPCGGNISIAEQPSGNWSAEMAAKISPPPTVVGYLANDWEQLTLHVARVEQNATNTTIQFAEFTPYGMCEAMEGASGSLVDHCGGAAPGRFTVSGLLSEVDAPGEWWYDGNAHKLYIYPPLPTSGSWTAARLARVRLGHWQGPGLISIENSSYVTLRDVGISGVGSGTIVAIAGGDHNTVGGCTLSNSVGTAVSIGGGHHNRMIG
eukprot:SAG11_NODE_4559_length_1851_cov_1.934932_2_plen_418_part_00